MHLGVQLPSVCTTSPCPSGKGSRRCPSGKRLQPVCVGCPHLPPARCGAASSKSTMNHGPSRSAWSRGWQSSHDGAQERRTETKRSFAKCVAWCVVVMVATKEMSDPSVTRTRHITPGTQQTWGVPHPGVCATSPCPCGKGPGFVPVYRAPNPVCVGSPHALPARCGVTSSKSTLNQGLSR